MQHLQQGAATDDLLQIYSAREILEAIHFLPAYRFLAAGTENRELPAMRAYRFKQPWHYEFSVNEVCSYLLRRDKLDETLMFKLSLRTAEQVKKLKRLCQELNRTPLDAHRLQ